MGNRRHTDGLVGRIGVLVPLLALMAEQIGICQRTKTLADVLGQTDTAIGSNDASDADDLRIHLDRHIIALRFGHRFWSFGRCQGHTQ